MSIVTSTANEVAVKNENKVARLYIFKTLGVKKELSFSLLKL